MWKTAPFAVPPSGPQGAGEGNSFTLPSSPIQTSRDRVGGRKDLECLGPITKHKLMSVPCKAVSTNKMRGVYMLAPQRVIVFISVSVINFTEFQQVLLDSAKKFAYQKWQPHAYLAFMFRGVMKCGSVLGDMITLTEWVSICNIGSLS